jgi:hypothetical protein
MNDLAEETQNIKNRAQIFRNAALLRTLDRENRNRRYRYSRINNINNNNVKYLHTLNTNTPDWKLTLGNNNNNVPNALRYKKLTRNKASRNILKNIRARTRKHKRA